MPIQESTPSRRLSTLLVGLPGVIASPEADPHIHGIALDSRLVQAGFLFVALRGSARDGHAYIPEALQRGAAAIVGEQPRQETVKTYVQVQDSRQALAYLAAAFHGHPARSLVMIGVTGTDGKTTTANLIFQILGAAGLKSGMISTVNAVIGETTLDTGFHVTTPEAPQVQSYLSQMRAAGLTHVVLETTSHGLAQQRVAACEFDMAVVTNITHEHLDFHGSFEAYRRAKGSLFTSLEQTREKQPDAPRGAVLNRDDDSYDYLAQITPGPRLSYGLGKEADVIAEGIETHPEGLRFTARGVDLEQKRFTIPLETNLIGEFNVYNCLAAVTLARGVMRLDEGVVAAGCAALRGIPGRMEKIDLGQNFTAMVDFAHTPNALRRALQAARLHTSGRVIAVFGSAGLRDREKRRLMAQTALELADLTILTAEDPRRDSLKAILEEMAAGARMRGGEEGRSFWRIPDRREALRFAVKLAASGDLVIACGKGHEQSMCFGEIEYPWDDRTALKAALAEHLSISGETMPYLPEVNE